MAIASSLMQPESGVRPHFLKWSHSVQLTCQAFLTRCAIDIMPAVIKCLMFDGKSEINSTNSVFEISSGQICIKKFLCFSNFISVIDICK